MSHALWKGGLMNLRKYRLMSACAVRVGWQGPKLFVIFKLHAMRCHYDLVGCLTKRMLCIHFYVMTHWVLDWLIDWLYILGFNAIRHTSGDGSHWCRYGIGRVVTSGFNATLTARVISWRSMTHMSLTPVLTQLSFQSHWLLFSHTSELRIRRKLSQPCIEFTTTWSCVRHGHEQPRRGEDIRHNGVALCPFLARARLINSSECMATKCEQIEHWYLNEKATESRWLIIWCLTPYLTLFQLYCSGQNTYWFFTEVLATSTRHVILSRLLANFPHRPDYRRNNGQ